jgi:hypothetical protein
MYKTISVSYIYAINLINYLNQSKFIHNIKIFLFNASELTAECIKKKKKTFPEYPIFNWSPSTTLHTTI